MLATEYNILQLSNNCTHQTVLEMSKAQDAFNRLDLQAESYCRDIHGTYPPKIGIPEPQDFNGFFIRDDVATGFIGIAGSLRYQHFNRPGLTLNSAAKIFKTINGDWQRIADMSATDWADLNPTILSPIPQFPVEVSQDQLNEIFVGLGLCSKYMSYVSYNGIWLGDQAKDIIKRSHKYIAESLAASWQIMNPVSNSCAYGVSSQTANMGISGCIDGGAIMWQNAYGATGAIINATGHNFSYSLQPAHADYWQAQGLVAYHYPFTDMMFADNYAAWSRNWFLGVYFPYNMVNVTWKYIKHHSQSLAFQTPHIPLLYKLNYPGNEVDYQPESCTFNEELDNLPYSFPSYEKLLNSSTPCGNYHYQNPEVWGSKKWSGVDRLGHPSARANHEYSCDFNNIDYMELFNLYSTVKTCYLPFVFISYWENDFSESFPKTQGTIIQGTVARQLTLNYLEYLGTRSVINSSGYVTFRGAKAIDFKPGFRAEVGCGFKGYVQDYSCANGPERYCKLDGGYHYATIKEEVYRIPCETPIVFASTNFVPFPMASLNNSADVNSPDYYEDLATDSLLTPEMEQEAIDSLMAHIAADSNFSTMLEIIPNIGNLYSNNSLRSSNLSSSRDSHFNGKRLDSAYGNNNNSYSFPYLFPNPSTDTIQIHLPKTSDYQFEVFALPGNRILNISAKNVQTLKLKLGHLASGPYFLKILSANETWNLPFSIMR